MDARYKIHFSGEFKEWVKREKFIQAISQHLGVSENKAAALYRINRKVILKKNLSEAEADRHVAAFEKTGMLVTKKLMMKPIVGPQIELQSRVAIEEQNDVSEPDVDSIPVRKRGLSNLTSGLRSFVNKNLS